MTNFKYKCDFCFQHFVYERNFLAHNCKEMKRDEEFRSVDGQAAWLYYQRWMRAYKRTVPKSSAFLHSKFFNSFIKFVRFSHKVQIPDIDSFIRLMKQKNITPMLWTNDQVYSKYIEFWDRSISPIKPIQLTISTLMDVADIKNVDVSEVFDVLHPSEVIMLLRRRQLSPWVLLKSEKFQRFYVSVMSNEDQIIAKTIICPHYWTERFEKYPEMVKTVKTIIAELNI